MTERPIIFSGDMVRAILAGSKTQTRRPVKPQPLEHPACVWRGGEVVLSSGLGPAEYCRDTVCPFGVPGDRLWVKEKHVLLDRDGWIDTTRPRDELFPTQPYPRRNGVGYSDWEHDADSERCRRDYGYKWRPSIHMPRWASRLTLEVVAVRVERVQDISEADAIAEGLDPETLGGQHCVDGMRASAVWFMDRWARIYPSSWERNDWVWAVEFRVLAELLRAETQAAPAAEART